MLENTGQVNFAMNFTMEPLLQAIIGEHRGNMKLGVMIKIQALEGCCFFFSPTGILNIKMGESLFVAADASVSFVGFLSVQYSGYVGVSNLHFCVIALKTKKKWRETDETRTLK